MPLPTKPYRRRFPLSRKGRLSPPVIREYTTTFELDLHDFKYPKEFLRSLGIQPNQSMRELPLQRLLDGVRGLNGKTGVVKLWDYTNPVLGMVIVRVTRRTRIGDKLRAYFASHRPSNLK